MHDRITELRERFTKWYYRKGYRAKYRDAGPGFKDMEIVFLCPWYLRPFVWFLWSPSVYHMELGYDICRWFEEGLQSLKGIIFMQNYSDQDYYWAKAEFQDSVAHRQHVENYKQGKPDCDYFHEQYKIEALSELYEEYKKEWCEARGYILAEIDESVGINGECYVCREEWYNNEYKENGGVL